MPLTFASILGRHLHRSHSSVNRLALLSGVPQRTIANWLNGLVQKPHQWQPILSVALSLYLAEQETEELLRAAKQPSLKELRLRAVAESDVALLSRFHAGSVSRNPAPFQVVADTPTFVGRINEIRELKRALLNRGRAIVVGLRGMGGVGKTALAARLAYSLREKFPDGILWARLDASDTLTILGAFAKAYGQDVSHYNDVESRSSVVRSLFADKRALIVLDNAETSAQVRPLLPPSISSCAVLITTRNDLSVLDGWRRMVLGPFERGSLEVLQLFEQYLGRDFIRLHSARLLDIAALVGNLPLALGIIAGRLANNLDDPSIGKQDRETNVLAEMLDSLSASRTRLSLLARDDLGVHASFDVSYEALSPFQKEFFSAMGIFDGQDFTSGSAAFLLNVSPEKAEEELEKLETFCLVLASPSKNWHLHPLLRDYARGRLEQSRQMVPVAARMLLMYRYAVSGQWSFSRTLDEEVNNIRYALVQARRAGLYRPVLETVQDIYPALSTGAWFSLARIALEQARAAAHELGDVKTDLSLTRKLSMAQLGLGAISGVRENLLSALRLARSMNSAEDVFDILNALGKLEHDTGHRKQANVYFEECLVVARTLNSPLLLSRSINNLVANRMIEARYEESREMLLESLQIVRACEGAEAPHRTLMNLGALSFQFGNLEDAHSYYQEALPLARSGKYRPAIAAILSSLAKIYAHRGERLAAEKFCNEAVQLALEINSPRIEGISRGELGQVLRQQGRLDEALEQLELAGGASVKAGDREQECVILHYLGLLWLDLDKLTEAQNVLEKALLIADEIDHKILVADVRFAQAKVFFADGRIVDAESRMEEGLAICRDLNLHSRIKDIKMPGKAGKNEPRSPRVPLKSPRQSTNLQIAGSPIPEEK